MSPSVNHPLSSRAALVPAMLVGAAVALALLAIPSAAASGGPGEWLLTGLENRWNWGADWTPDLAGVRAGHGRNLALAIGLRPPRRRVFVLPSLSELFQISATC